MSRLRRGDFRYTKIFPFSVFYNMCSQNICLLVSFSAGSRRRVSGTNTELICPLYPQMCTRRKNDRKNVGILRVQEWGMARSGRFELPTPRFVVWCSIQLSYERIAAGQTHPCKRRPHHRPSICRWQARTSARNARHFVGRSQPSLLPLCTQTLLSTGFL